MNTSDELGKSLLEQDDMIVLEILSEKLIEEFQVLLKAIDAYKSKHADLTQFNCKKEHLSAVININGSFDLVKKDDSSKSKSYYSDRIENSNKLIKKMVAAVCDISKSSMCNAPDGTQNISFKNSSNNKNTSTPASNRERITFDFNATTSVKFDSTHKPISNVKFQECKRCGKSFKVLGLTRHLKSCSGTLAEKDSLKEIVAETKDKPKLEIHNSQQLLEITIKSEKRSKALECKVCHKVYREKSKYETHMKKHEAKDKFKCTECPMTFEKQQYFDSHLKNHNIKQKIKVEPLDSKSRHPIQIKQFYGCATCDKQFLYESSLKRHLKLENCKGKAPFSMSSKKDQLKI